VDPSRVNDPEIAGEGERDRLKSLGARFSREDLLRSFDLLTRAELDIRGAAQPRYHLEMALLRWIHLRKLVPIEDLIAGAASAPASTRTPAPALPSTPAVSPARPASSPVAAPGPRRPQSLPAGRSAAANTPAAPVTSGVRQAAAIEADGPGGSPVVPSVTSTPPNGEATFKDAFLAEVRKTKVVLYNMVVAQAQKIEVSADRVAFTYSATQRTLCETLEQHRAWLETIAGKLAGRKVTVVAVQTTDAAAAVPGQAPDASVTRKSELREQALADAGVQALLEVFPAEIRDVEEM
jgi:DNA polymerase III gamma/tau subunit